MIALDRPDMTKRIARRIPAQEGADLLGVTVRRFRQIATEQKWPVKTKPVRGGNQHFYQIADVLAYEPVELNPNQFQGVRIPEDATPEVIRKYNVLAPILALPEEGVARAVAIAAKSNSTTSRTIYRWLKSYRENGFDGLGDGRRGNINAAKADTSVYRAAFSIYASHRSPTFVQAFKAYNHLRDIEPERCLPEISLRTLINVIHEFPPVMVARLRGGDGARNARKNFIPTILRDWTGVRVMGCWMGDGTAWDQLVYHPDYKNPIRPWLVIWMDVRSRCIVGWRLVVKVNSASAMLALRDGIRAYGMPDELYVDNGKEYENRNSRGQKVKKGRIDIGHIKGYLDQIGLKQRNAWPYNPESKAEVERWFSTLSGSFLRVFPGWTGGNITSKTRKKDDALLKDDIKKGRLFTFDQAKELCASVIRAYNSNPHEGLGKEKPAKVFIDLHGKTANGRGDHPVTYVPDRTLDFALSRREVVTIQSAGVEIYTVKYRAENRLYRDACGRKGVVAWDPDDMTVVRLYEIVNGRQQYVCDIYPDPGVDVKNEEEMRRKVAQKKKDEKAVRVAAQTILDKSIKADSLLQKAVLAVDEDLMDQMNQRFSSSRQVEDKSIVRFPAGGIAGTPKDTAQAPTPVDIDEDEERIVNFGGLFGEKR